MVDQCPQPFAHGRPIKVNFYPLKLRGPFQAVEVLVKEQGMIPFVGAPDRVDALWFPGGGIGQRRCGIGSGFNGFAVVDFATHTEIKRIKNPDLPPGRSTIPEGADPSHGMAVTPDNKTLVVCSRLNNALYSYSLPDLTVAGTVFLGGKGAAWVTLTPDGKRAYVSNAVTNNVSVVDVPTMKEVALIAVGFVPKRNTTGILPQ